PPTYVGGQPAVGAQQQAGWGFQILPFIEGDSVWRAGPGVAIATPNPLFFCPSRRGPQTGTHPDQQPPPPPRGAPPPPPPARPAPPPRRPPTPATPPPPSPGGT